MRVSKRLLFAIISLVLSVVLCAGVCLAWFSVNGEVGAGGPPAELEADIVDFNVKAYYLEFSDETKTEYVKSDNGNISASFDKVVDLGSDGTVDNSYDQMRPYDPVRSYSTAVLFEIDYTLNAKSGRTFRIYSACPYVVAGYLDENVFTVKEGSSEEEFLSTLSNCVFMSKAQMAGGVYSYSRSDSQTFIKDDYTKNYKKVIAEGITASNNVDNAASNTGKLLVIVDYDTTLFTGISTYMLEEGGLLNSRLTFGGDIVFGMESYTGTEPVPEVTSVAIVNSTSTTYQSVGNTDYMSSTWKFVLNFSDGTYETVKYNPTDFSIEMTEFNGAAKTGSGLYTQEVGTGKALVTYKGSLTTEVAYAINQGSVLQSLTIRGTDTVAVGGNITLTVIPEPADASYDVTWTVASKDGNGKASVNENGVVTGEAIGVVTVTATSTADPTITATYDVNVVNGPDSIAFKSGGTAFKQGVAADTSDWKFTLTYKDGATEEIGATDVNIGSVNTASATESGSLTVTLKTNTSITCNVDYKVKAPASIAFKSGTDTFAQNSEADTSDWKFTVTYPDGLGTADVGSSAVTIGNIDTSSAGSKTVEVKLNIAAGVTCSVPYNVTGTGIPFTTGTHTLDIAGGQYGDIYSGNVASSDGGFGSGHFKLASGDYLDITVKLKAGQTLTVRGTAIQGNTSRSVTLGMSVVTAESTGAFTDRSEYTKEFNGSSEAPFEHVYTVQTEGVIVVRLERNTTATGCNITALSVIVDETPETYTVIWKNHDGAVLETDTGVEKGATPVYDGATPAREATAQYSYEFSGWSPAVGAISGDTTYTAQFTETLNSYTVTFDANGHGDAPAAQTVDYNGTATEPTAPTAAGFTFGGWYKEQACTNAFDFGSDKITADTTLYAKWTESGGTGTEVVYTFSSGNKAPACDNANGTITLSNSGATKQNGYIKLGNGGGGSITLTIKNAKKGSKVTIELIDGNGKTGQIYSLTVTNLTENNGEYTVTDAGDITIVISENNKDYYFGSAVVTVTEP